MAALRPLSSAAARLRVAPRHGALSVGGGASAAGAAAAVAAPAAAPAAPAQARSMGTMKDMMVRAAIAHVTSSLAHSEPNPKDVLRASDLQDADDVETWRAIVDMHVSSADNVTSSDLYLVSEDLVDALDLSAHPGATTSDPFAVVADDLAGVNDSIKRILGVDHPVLARVARYFFEFDSGKKMRPAMVLLMGRAVNSHMEAVNQLLTQQQCEPRLPGGDGAGEGGAALPAATGRSVAASPRADAASSSSSSSAGRGDGARSGGALGWDPRHRDLTVSYATDGMPVPLARALAERAGRLAASAAGHPAGAGAAAVASSASSRAGGGGGAALLLLAPTPLPPAAVFPLQARLAEVTEMIHTASLLHDDVIDTADTRRGLSSANSAFGNKLAVLAGDFLLARASVSLARLRSIPVVELLSTVIEHLVKGEVMQMKGAAGATAASREAFEGYLRKTYYKTGSLMANSCKAIAMLGCYPDYVCTAAFKYGLHVGVAFQLVDDLLDFQGTAATLGKPALADIKSGLATAPVLFAAQQFPALLLPLIQRKFEGSGDVESALKLIADADGLAATRRLAIAHGQMALDALDVLAPSPARTALAALVSRVLDRER